MKLLSSVNVLTLIFLVEMVCGTRLGYHYKRYNKGKGNSYWYKKTCSYAKCQCLNKDTTPAFSAVLTHAPNVAANTAVKFDKVVTNIQDGYDPATGIFTAPTDGVYHISSTVTSPRGGKLFVSLYQNDMKITSIWVSPADATYEMGTTNMVLDLKEGDEVSIRSRGNYVVHSSSDFYSSFSGFMISK
ncbi:collagen alpha-2(VIII) chain-like [Mytilus edulis]|uniref:collagen alpha-2(VIII) chain-like n=1 Tax=Mytilus edulis TaxID=6550 RepID=UPI0039EFB7A9